MKYSIGVCTSLDRAPLAAKAGAEHIEPGFAATANLDEQTFRTGLSILRDSGLYVDAMNSMLPGTAALYGDASALAPVLELFRRGMERAAEIGCKTVVLGSGTARRIPDGMTREQAMQKFSAVVAGFCEIARPYGIRIAIEPLRAFETNFIHTVADAAEIIGLCPDSVALGITPDIYHMLEGGEAFDELRRFSDKLFHAHICAPDRHYPSPERPAEDTALYRDFFRALDAANYQGTISIEGIATDMVTDLPSALAILDAAQDQI